MSWKLQSIAPILAVITLALPGIAAVNDVRVSNVQFEQTPDDRVLITYDLESQHPDTFVIDLWVSLDGGADFVLQPVSVSGEVGAGVTAGQSKEIWWDVMADLPKLEETALVFKVTATWSEPNLAIEIPEGRDNRAISKYNIGANWGDYWAVISLIPSGYMRNEKAGWHETVTTMGHADPPPLPNSGALYYQPVGPKEPAIIEGSFKINRPDISLNIQAVGSRGFDWRMYVKVNGSEVGNWVVDGSEWHKFTVPLTNYSDTEVNIRIFVAAHGWNRDYAHISKIWFTDSSGKEIYAQ